MKNNAPAYFYFNCFFSKLKQLRNGGRDVYLIRRIRLFIYFYC